MLVPIRKYLSPLPIQSSFNNLAFKELYALLDFSFEDKDTKFTDWDLETGSHLFDLDILKHVSVILSQRFTPNYFYSFKNNYHKTLDEMNIWINKVKATNGEKISPELIVSLGNIFAKYACYPIITKFFPDILLEKIMVESRGIKKVDILRLATPAETKTTRLFIDTLRLALAFREDKSFFDLLIANPQEALLVIQKYSLQNSAFQEFTNKYKHIGSTRIELEGNENPLTAIKGLSDSFTSLPKEYVLKKIQESEKRIEKQREFIDKRLKDVSIVFKSMIMFLHFLAECLDGEVGLYRGFLYDAIMPVVRKLALDLRDKGYIDRSEDVFFYHYDELVKMKNVRNRINQRKKRYFDIVRELGDKVNQESLRRVFDGN